MSGFYLMHRDWMSNPVLDPDEPFDRRSAWVWLIEHAAFEPAKVKAGSKIVALERGQLSFSLRYLGKAWKWGHERVRRFLARLQTEAMIETVSETGQLLITICNYDKYQVVANLARQPSRRAARQERDSSETNIKEGKEDSDIPSGISVAVATEADALKQMWSRGVAQLGEGARSLLGKARKQYGDLVVSQAIAACEEESPAQPVEFFVKCLEWYGQHERSQEHAYSVLAQAARDYDERQNGGGAAETPHRPAWGAEELGDGGAAIH